MVSRSVVVSAIARLATAVLLLFLAFGCKDSADRQNQNPSSGIFVVNYSSSSVTRYPIGASGDVAPSNRGPAFSFPSYFAIDPTRGRIVVANDSNIEVFSSLSRGYANPISIIAGPHTGLSPGGLTGVAVDGSGNIYVANGLGYQQQIMEFAAGSRGDVLPVSAIALPGNLLAPTPLGLAVDLTGNIYAANVDAGSITEFAPGSNGNIAPIATIRGDDTGLERPSGVVVRFGKVYVSDFIDRILVYPVGSNGNARPIAFISGPSTGLSSPSDLDVDAVGNILVSNFGSNSITEYSAGSTGDVKPIAKISGPKTHLNEPRGVKIDKKGEIRLLNLNSGNPSLNTYSRDATGNVSPRYTLGAAFNRLAGPDSIALDSNGNIYVGNFDVSDFFVFGAGSVAEFGAGTGATVAPLRFIAGPHTGLGEVMAIAVDKMGNIYVANVTGSTSGFNIMRFGPRSNGNAAPDLTISGSNTQLDYPNGIVIDRSGNIYVTNDASDSVTVYTPGSSGNVTPIATIRGANTGLSQPTSVGFDSAGNLYVANGVANSVTVYPPDSDGDIAPLRRISIPGTISGMFVDPAGDVYIVDGLTESIREYAVGRYETPVEIIQGPHTQLRFPSAVAVRR